MCKTIRCIVVDDEPVARDILENHLSKIETIEIVKSCKNATEAFSAVSLHSVDLIFLDINMPEISGLDFAKSINQDIKIIFTTAYREYAVDGFNLQAVDYLLKPISFERLLQGVHKYLGEKSPVKAKVQTAIIPEKSPFIFVRSDRKMVKINFEDIRYIESLADYIKIQLNDHTVVTRETISTIESKLPQQEFVRVHRSFIVSIDKITSYTNEFIEIASKAIPISRSYKTNVLAVLEQK